MCVNRPVDSAFGGGPEEMVSILGYLLFLLLAAHFLLAHWHGVDQSEDF